MCRAISCFRRFLSCPLAHVLPFYFIAGACLFFGLTCAAQTTAPDFSIIVLPDTQYYAQDYPQTFMAQTQWVVNNLSALNIQAVIGVGDIVNGGGVTSQWQAASGSVSKLEGKVPYFFAIGNHDYDKDDPPNRTASTKNFNNYFGPARYAHSYSGWLGSYPAGSNENFYGSITIAGKRYLIVALEFYPRTTALQWAGGIIQANPDAEVILVTHGYGYWDNTRVAHCENYDAEYYNMGKDNDGEEIWANLASKYPNISMVLSGHIIKAAGQMSAGHQTQTGVSGNIVNEIMADYQDMANGGNGYLRILKFSPSQNKIQVSTYSPTLHSYLTDSANAFTVPWHATVTTGNGAISGYVKNPSCGLVAGAKVSYSGGSTTTGTNGKYTLSNVPAGLQSVTVTAPGFPAFTKNVAVGPGLTSSALFFLTTTPAPSPTPTPSPTPSSSPTPTPSPSPTATPLPSPTPSPSPTPTSSPTPTPSPSPTATPLPSPTPSPSPTPTVTPSPTPTPTPAPTAPGAIAGRVTNASTSAAISGVTVSAGGHSAVTDATGNYSLSSLAPGSYSVTTSKSGWLSQSKTTTVSSGTTTNLSFAIATSGILSGTVKNASGAAVTGATVTIKGGVVATTKVLLTSSTGSYSSGWIAVGGYSVTITQSGHTAQTKSATVATGTTTTLNFTSF